MNVLNLGSPREPWVGCDSPLCVAILSDCNATVLELNAIDAIWSVLSRTGLPGNWKLTHMLTIGVVGGGPAALMFLKTVVEKLQPVKISIFESSNRIGCGMPYGDRGASLEHVTNISSDEMPPLEQSLADWVGTLDEETLARFSIDKNDFHEKEVAPRLLFGMYLEAQFYTYIEMARLSGFDVQVFLNTRVTGLKAKGDHYSVVAAGEEHIFDKIVLCTGHHWPCEHEGKVPGYFDSPYPPNKLSKKFNHTVGMRGSSLTAVDAIRTLARSNGKFVEQDSRLTFEVDKDVENFRIEMHSKHGLLPCLRVHMEEPYLDKDSVISKQEIERDIERNDGFLGLDFLFERGFKQPLRETDPDFFQTIKDLSLEEFIEKMMSYRTEQDPFTLFLKEFKQSLKSIQEEKPVPWKEMLAALSIALNYPAKHMSAEDMLRLQNHLLPLVSTVIAFIPQSSAKELLALHDAGRLELITDGETGSVDVEDGKIVYRWEEMRRGAMHSETRIYETFIDCIGQRPLEEDDFPFSNLKKENITSPARLRFRDETVGKKLRDEGNKNVIKEDDEFFLSVPGMDISDNFQLVNREGVASDGVFLMAVPFMGGLNPDYSGLDFCENAAQLIIEYLKNGMLSKAEQVSNRQIQSA